MRRSKWTFVEVQARANLYTNRGDFLKNDFNAYSATLGMVGLKKSASTCLRLRKSV